MNPGPAYAEMRRIEELEALKTPLNRRVAITGLGVVTPAGIGVAAFWASLFTSVPPQSVRRVAGFDARRWMSHKAAKNSDVATQFAIAAADEALRDAGFLPRNTDNGSPSESDVTTLVGIDLDRAAVSLGTGIGGVQTLETQMGIRRDRGDRLVSPHTVPMVMPNAAAAAISIRFGLRGSASTVTTACAAGTDAIAAGARMIASGQADVVIAGGTDSSLTPTCLAGFANMRALSKSGVSRPFDRDRNGLAASEACGIVVLESLDGAIARGAHVYMTVEGSASTSDAHHVTAPSPDGTGAERCMRLALEDAGLVPSDVTHVNAHGTSTGLNDAAEGAAISRVFNDHPPLVTSIKGVTGHSFGAAGAVEAVAIALTMRFGVVPPTIGLQTIDPEIDLRVATAATPWEPAPVLSNSFGFGGHNGSLVFAPSARVG